MQFEEYTTLEIPDANRALGSSSRYFWNKTASRWFNLSPTQRVSRRVATTSLCGLVAQMRGANRCETIIWLTVAASALAVLVLSFSLAA
jgi:hypothetical protein